MTEGVSEELSPLDLAQLPTAPFGIGRLRRELGLVGYETAQVQADNIDYAAIAAFRIPLGRFAGTAIGLALPAPPDFPASIGASIHVRAVPPLFPLGNTGSRNIIVSKLGDEWQYWSYRFPWPPRQWDEPDAARALLARVRQVFANA